MLGMRRRAIAYFAAVVGLLLGGVLIGDITFVSLQHRPASFILHFFTGAPALLLTLFTNMMAVGYNPTRWGDIGMTMTWIAGALNVLLIADVLDRANGGPFESENPKPSWTRRILHGFKGKQR